MCQCTNEPDGFHTYLVERIAYLEKELDECQLRSIEARNPGIDMDEVKKVRASMKQDRRCECGNIARYPNGCCPSGCVNRPA